MQRVVYVLFAALAGVRTSEAGGLTPLPFPLAPLIPFAPVYDSVMNQRCKNDSLIYLNDLRDMKLWAVQMYDSAGKISSGVLRGNVMWLGDDMECLRVSSKPSAGLQEDNIRGQYCVASVYAEPKSNDADGSDLEEIYDRIHSYGPLVNSHDDPIGFFPSFSPLYIGLCVPHSCTADDFRVALSEWLSAGNVFAGVNVSVVVPSDACLKEPRLEMHSKAKATLFFYAFMTLVGIAGSLYEYRERHSKSGEVVNRDAQIDELGCLHGIRAIFCVDLYVLHKLIVFLNNAMANREDMLYFAEGAASMPLRAFWSQVDTFVVLSGLLTSYNSVKRMQEGRRLNVIKMYLTRYIKFTPMFLVCVLWLENLAEYMLAQSQYLRYGKHFTNSCKSGWFNVLTYTNTFRGIDNMCYTPAHQLETDMHMFLLAPLLILFLWKIPKIAVPAIFGMMAYLSFIKYQVIFTEKLATIIYYGIPLTLLSKTANRLYLNVFHRLVPYLAGILLGYYLRVRDQRKRLPKVFLIAGSGFALWCAHYSFLSMVHNAKRNYVYDVEEAASYGTLQPLYWSYAICWFIYICASGQTEWINRPLSWKGFLVSSRLSFAFYLSQLAVMMAEVGRIPTPITFSPSMIFDLNTFAKVILVTIWLTLLFLYPIAEIQRIFAKEPDTATAENQEKD